MIIVHELVFSTININMEKLSQIELISEFNLLGALRTAGKAAAAVGRGVGAVAKGIHALDPEGFNTIAAPFKYAATPIAGIGKGIAAITPTNYIKNGIKGWFMFAKDYFLNEIKTTYRNTFDPKSITDVKAGIDRGEGQEAIPGQDAIEPEEEIEARDAVEAQPASTIIDPSTGQPATPAVEAQPAVGGRPAVEGRPAVDPVEAKLGPLAKGRTVITFKAKRYIATGGGSEQLEDFKAILTRDARSSNLKLMDPNTGYSMTIYDAGNHVVSGSKSEAVPNFNKIFNYFLKQNRLTKAPDKLTPEQVKQLISNVYIQNHKVYGSNEENKFQKLLQQAAIAPTALKNELIKQRLVEKVNVSQKILLEQLKSI